MSCGASWLEFDGLYLHENDDCNRYLRFCDDGTALFTAARCSPKELILCFNPGDECVSEGKYKVDGNRISFEATNEQGTIEF
jgi:hypothetical protein